MVLVARLGPSFELEWSRRLVHDWPTSSSKLNAGIRPFAVDEHGIALSTEIETNPSLGALADAWWLTQIDAQGGCAESFSIALGGYVGSGEPAWSVTLSCPGATEQRLDSTGTFDAYGRLWWIARTDRRVLVEVEL